VRTIRVGNCSGFYGDRISAMREMLEGGQLDYLTGDYLAELTMHILGKDQMRDPNLGYAKTFLRQMTDCLALAHEKGVKIVANAGGLNPAGLAEKLRDVATAQGIDIAIAHVEGDKLDGASFGGALTANAYLGGFGIAAALQAGADIVVTGRVTDAAVVIGPAIAEFDWSPTDFDALAGAVIAGHVIECGTQATGGNYSGFTEFVTEANRTVPLGFAIAEIDALGNTVITKHEGTGGQVTVDTVTAQLVYEIQGPHYLNPDAAVRLDSLELHQQAPDRVAITNVAGVAPPATTKVCLNRLGGFRNHVEFVLTGLDIEAKAAWITAQLEAAIAGNRPEVVEWHLDRTDKTDPASEREAAAFLSCHVRDADEAKVGRAFSGAAIEQVLASFGGFHLTTLPSSGRAYGVYQADYVPQDSLAHAAVLGDGTRIEITPPTVFTDTFVSTSDPSPVAEVSGPTQRVPLGRLVHARSGDKGGNANIGLWIPSGHADRAAAAAWLLGFITPEKVRELLPEAAGLKVEVHPLANLAGLNILIYGLLGEGVASSSRFDPQAKALGEWIRARYVDLPEAFL
jgi:hypothetical protein